MSEENKVPLFSKQDPDQEKITPPPSGLNPDEPRNEPYIPSSKGKRIAAWIGVVLMVFLVIMYTYSLATGSFLNW